MDWREFVFLVAEMRNAQNDYFAFRNPRALRQAKNLERQVDRAVADMLAALEGLERERASQLGFLGDTHAEETHTLIF